MEDKKIITIIAIIVIVVIALLITSRWIAEDLYRDALEMAPEPPDLYAPAVEYEKNETAHTITIISIEGKQDELLWSNVELWTQPPYSTYATLPTGTIDVGDVITDCDGLVNLKWKPTGGDFIQEVFD